MHPVSRFLTPALLALFISACAAGQPPTDTTPDVTAATTVVSPNSSENNNGTPATDHADHGEMDMDAATSFDAMFIDGMIEHHQGAIDMAKMALEQAEHEELRTLAQEIIAAQTTEIEQMQSWRNEWYPDQEATAGMDMEMGEMTISEDVSKPFDQRFIEAMISHHEGAIAMAEMALEQAEHEEIRTLAEEVIAAQNAEIEQMQGWLADWYGVSK